MLKQQIISVIIPPSLQLWCACFVHAQHTQKQAEDQRRTEGSSTLRPITTTTQDPVSVKLISPPTCFCDLQEGINSEVCLPTNQRASLVRTLQGQAPSPLSVHLSTLRKIFQCVPSEARLIIHSHHPK